MNIAPIVSRTRANPFPENNPLSALGVTSCAVPAFVVILNPFLAMESKLPTYKNYQLLSQNLTLAHIEDLAKRARIGEIEKRVPTAIKDCPQNIKTEATGLFEGNGWRNG